MAQVGDAEQASGGAAAVLPGGLMGLGARYVWLLGAAAVLVVLVVSLLVWGPGMEFPTTVSRSEVPTAGTRTLTLERTVREVSGDVIDDGVDWLTEEGDWLFDGMSDGVTHALVAIEDVLRWVPWPAAIAVLALLSFAVGRWRLTGFTTAALLYVGFMGLWNNGLVRRSGAQLSQPIWARRPFKSRPI